MTSMAKRRAKSRKNFEGFWSWSGKQVEMGDGFGRIPVLKREKWEKSRWVLKGAGFRDGKERERREWEMGVLIIVEFLAFSLF